MECNCKWTETILAVVIIVFAWPGLINWMYSGWLLVIVGVLLLIHAWKCKNCGVCMPEQAMPKAKKKR